MAALAKATEATVSVRLRDKPAPITVAIERRPNVVSIRESSAQRRDNRLERTARTTAAAGWRGVGGRTANRPGNPAESRYRTDGSRELFGRTTVLSDVRLESRRGISNGTVDYLRAVCYKQLKQPAEARRLFEAASQDEGARLTEFGPVISYLAKEELSALASPAQE